MNRIPLIICLGGLIFNSISGLNIEGYVTFNWLIVDVSILLSAVIYYYLPFYVKSDALKIVLFLGYGFTGIIRMLIAFFMLPKWGDNILLLFFVLMVFIELGLLYVSRILDE